MKIKNTLPVVCLIWLAGCNADVDRNWMPAIDGANDPHVGMLRVDLDECQRTALHAPTPSTPPGKNPADSANPDQAYKSAYTACMKQRGHPVIGSPAEAPATGTPATTAPAAATTPPAATNGVPVR